MFVVLLFTSATTDGGLGSCNINNLKFEKRKINIGKIYSDTLIQTTFKYTNCGNKPVKIISVNKSCTCSNVFLSDSVIMPNQISSIVLTIDTRMKDGKFRVNAILVADTKQRFIIL